MEFLLEFFEELPGVFRMGLEFCRELDGIFRMGLEFYRELLAYGSRERVNRTRKWEFALCGRSRKQIVENVRMAKIGVDTAGKCCEEK